MIKLLLAHSHHWISTANARSTKFTIMDLMKIVKQMCLSCLMITELLWMIISGKIINTDLQISWDMIGMDILVK